MTIKIGSISQTALSQAFSGIDDAQGIKTNVMAAASRLDIVGKGNNNRLVDTAEVNAVSRDDYTYGRAQLLTASEDKGAVMLLDLMKDADVTPVALPTVTPAVTFAPRPSSIQVSDVPAGQMSPGGNPSFNPLTRELVRGWGGGSVDLRAVAQRVASTPKALQQNGGNTLTPELLKAAAFPGDPYPSDSVYPELQTWMTADERAGLAVIYDKFFNPKPQVPAPSTVSTPIVSVGAYYTGQVDISLTTQVTPRVVDTINGRQTGPVTQLDPQSVSFKGPAGAVVMLGGMSGANPAVIDHSLTIPASGVLTVPVSPGQSLAGVVLQDPDGAGLLSPRILGNFAFNVPATGRVFGPKARTIDAYGKLHDVAADGTVS